MFAMAQGQREGPGGAARSAVGSSSRSTASSLATIDRNDPARWGAPSVNSARHAGSEYSEALRKAITNDVGVKRNEAALKSLQRPAFRQKRRTSERIGG